MGEFGDRPYETDADLLVLHTLRCIGCSGLGRVADAAGRPEADVEDELIDLGAAGLVTHTAGAFGGWALSEAGRAVVAERISHEVDSTGTRGAIADAYEAFLILNPELLELCTAWQTRTVHGAVTINNHTDAAYDARVLARLVDLDERVDAVLAALSRSLRRFERYRVRLTDALVRAQAGALEHVADSTASYHTVWFQLHEDLLVTLGIPRH